MLRRRARAAIGCALRHLWFPDTYLARLWPRQYVAASDGGLDSGTLGEPGQLRAAVTGLHEKPFHVLHHEPQHALGQDHQPAVKPPGMLARPLRNQRPQDRPECRKPRRWRQSATGRGEQGLPQRTKRHVPRGRAAPASQDSPARVPDPVRELPDQAALADPGSSAHHQHLAARPPRALKFGELAVASDHDGTERASSVRGPRLASHNQPWYVNAPMMRSWLVSLSPAAR